MLRLGGSVAGGVFAVAGLYIFDSEASKPRIKSAMSALIKTNSAPLSRSWRTVEREVGETSELAFPPSR